MTPPPLFPFIRVATVLFLCTVGPVLHAQRAPYWVTFTDKGPGSAERLAVMSASDLKLTRAALERRAAMAGIADAETRSADDILDRLRSYALRKGTGGEALQSLINDQDLPVDTAYIRAVLRSGARLRATSRWMNAISVDADSTHIGRIRSLACVAGIEPVRRFRRPAGIDVDPNGIMGKTGLIPAGGIDYGVSFPQLDLINVPKVHDVWIDGTDCLIGMLDVGYKWRSHEALKNINVLGEYDFINKDTVTENEDGDPAGQDGHGTVTLSALAGFKEGILIGPAFKGTFYLAKTEVVSSETPIEEDYWVEGMEWLESRGVAIASASLGYSTFDDSSGYYYENGDYDGKTAVTTRAASRAARLGVVLCTAMGNEGNRPGTLLVPADADTVLSIGAINYDNTVAGFSSNGPTNDGRIKPDIMTPGVRVWCAGTAAPDNYLATNGTSLATPLAAGVAALVRSARPELTPVQVREALRNTADKAAAPDNSHGWGRVDAWTALLYHGMVISTHPKVMWNGTQNVIAAYVLSPKAVYSSRIVVTYAIGKGPDLTAEMSLLQQYPGLATGSGLYIATLPELPANATVRYYISAADIAESRTSPYRAPMERHVFQVGETDLEGAGDLMPSSYALYQSYPNPYIARRDGILSIRYDVPSPGAPVSIELFDRSGRRVAILLKEFRAGGPHILRTQVPGLASGIYYYTLSASDRQLVKRMVILH